MGKRWADEEKVIVAKHYPTASWSELFELLPGRTQDEITSMAFRYKIKRDPELSSSQRSRALREKPVKKEWTVKDLASHHSHGSHYMTEDYFNHLLHIKNTLNGRAA